MREPRSSRLAGTALLVAVAAIWPYLASSSYLYLSVAGAILATATLGLTVVVGWAGEISLVQAGLIGLSANLTAYAIRSDTWDWPFLAGALFGIAAATLVAIVVALPTSKVSGIYIMILTLAMQVMIERSILARPELGGGGEFIVITRPRVFGISFDSDRAYYFLCAAVLTVVLVLLVLYRSSRHGRALMLVRTNRDAAASVGISSWYYKVLAFAISGALAGIAGALSAPLYRTVPFLGQYITFQSLYLLAIPVLAGFESLLAVVAVAMVFSLLPHMLESHQISPFLLGGAALMMGLLIGRRGLGGAALERLAAPRVRRALAAQGKP